MELLTTKVFFGSIPNTVRCFIVGRFLGQYFVSYLEKYSVEIMDVFLVIPISWFRDECSDILLVPADFTQFYNLSVSSA